MSEGTCQNIVTSCNLLAACFGDQDVIDRILARLDGKERDTTMIWPSSVAPHLEVLGDYWKHFTNDNLSVCTVKGEHDSWLDVSVFELGHVLAAHISSAARQI